MNNLDPWAVANREDARHKESGRFGEQHLTDPGNNLLNNPLMRKSDRIFSLALDNEGVVVSEGFPALTYTDRLWTAADPSMSRTKARKNRGKYRSPNVPDIAELSLDLDAELRTAADTATEAMRAFDDEAGTTTAPFAAVLLRSESSSSSQIERLSASARKISLATLGDQSSPNATQIARNVEAMRAAIDLADSLDVGAILSMHEHLMRDIEDDAGQLRNQLVWVGGDSPVTARHVGPEHEKVPGHLDDLVEFMRRNDMPPLLQAAIAHAQFETIHPFTDGNGRTGRALIPALLRRRGVTRNLSVPISAGLLGDTDSYFAALTAYRAGNPGPIVDRFTAAVGDSLVNARQLRTDVDAVHAQIVGIAERRTVNLDKLANFLVAEPAFTADMAVRSTGMPVATAYRLLGRLQASGLVRPEHKIRGEQVWTVPGTLAALDAFAQRAGKRTWRRT